MYINVTSLHARLKESECSLHKAGVPHHRDSARGRRVLRHGVSALPLFLRLRPALFPGAGAGLDHTCCCRLPPERAAFQLPPRDVRGGAAGTGALRGGAALRRIVGHLLPYGPLAKAAHRRPKAGVLGKLQRRAGRERLLLQGVQGESTGADPNREAAALGELRNGEERLYWSESDRTRGGGF